MYSNRSTCRTAVRALAAGAGAVALSVLPAQAQDERDTGMDATAEPGLIETLESRDLTTFARLVEAGNLGEELTEGEPLTLFVPSNAAFANVPEDAVQGFEKARAAVFHLTSEGTTTVLDVIDGKEQVSSLRAFQNTEALTVELAESGSLMVRDSDQIAHVVGGPIMSGDNVIHVIDSVLLPDPAPEAGTQR
jgi:uncharacterized surface protein with fasciclin (FAS1) repeats